MHWQLRWNFKFDFGFFNAFLLEKPYIKKNLLKCSWWAYYAPFAVLRYIYFIMIWKYGQSCNCYTKLRLALCYTFTKITGMVILQCMLRWNITTGHTWCQIWDHVVFIHPTKSVILWYGAVSVRKPCKHDADWTTSARFTGVLHREVVMQ